MNFQLTWGNRALDFVNTEDGVDDGHVERLHTFADVVDWLKQAGFVDDATAKHLRRAPHGSRTFTECIAFRAVMRSVCEKIAHGRRVTEIDLQPVNAALANLRVRASLESTASGIVQHVQPLIAGTNDIVPALAWLTMSLVDDVGRIRRCANERTCITYFVDDTKNHTRLWCDMKVCGNRAKAAAFRERKRAKSELP